MDLESYLSSRRRLIEKALDETLPHEDNEPKVLYQAMRYSLFAGGKRIRPILAIAAAEAVGGEAEDILPLAVALECIHTYSLVHDDLPAMDDDSLRRGKPTAHKVFGEAVAILAGDALLTFAFHVMSSPETMRLYRPERLLAVIGDLSFAAGPHELIAGQVLDITSEGKEVGVETTDSIVRRKTAALIRASVVCGAKLAGATRQQIELLSGYGENIGAVFQIRDDILDLEGDPEKLGKAVRKDGQRGKATFPRILGKEKSLEMMQSLLHSALERIRPLGKKAEPLVLIGKYVGERMN